MALKEILNELQGCHNNVAEPSNLPSWWSKDVVNRIGIEAGDLNLLQRSISHVRNDELPVDDEMNTTPDDDYGDIRYRSTNAGAEYEEDEEGMPYPFKDEPPKRKISILYTDENGEEKSFPTSANLEDVVRMSIEKSGGRVLAVTRDPAPEEQEAGEPETAADTQPADEVPTDEVPTEDPEGDLGDGSLDDEFADEAAAEPQEWDDPNYQGIIRTVPDAHLVYKRQQEDGTFNELWQYNIGDDFKEELATRRGIIAGTDIPIHKMASPDNTQTYELWTAGNAQILYIRGLPN